MMESYLAMVVLFALPKLLFVISLTCLVVFGLLPFLKNMVTDESDVYIVKSQNKELVERFIKNYSQIKTSILLIGTFIVFTIILATTLHTPDLHNTELSTCGVYKEVDVVSTMDYDVLHVQAAS